MKFKTFETTHPLIIQLKVNMIKAGNVLLNKGSTEQNRRQQCAANEDSRKHQVQ